MEIGGANFSTRGDVAAGAIGYAVGYIIDTFYFSGGLTGGVVAGVSAVGAVGLKNLFETAWTNFRNRPDNLQGSSDLEQRAEKLLRYITRVVDRSTNPKEHALRPALEEYERFLDYWRNGLIDTNEFYNNYFLPATKEFRKHLSAAPYAWVGQ